MRRSLWEARLEHLEGKDIVEVICKRCGHQREFTAMQIMRRVKPEARMADGGLTLDTPVMNLRYHFRCSRCPRGKDAPQRDLHVRVFHRPEGKPPEGDPPPDPKPPTVAALKRRA